MPIKSEQNIRPSNYDQLLELFQRWRDFEMPPMSNGAPDYTSKRFDEQRKEFLNLKNELKNIDTTKWPIYHQVDWHIVQSEMNGYDFNYRVLKPWSRDPAFYQTIWMYESDVPAHEGPTNHGTLEFWSYQFPLDKENKEKIKRKERTNIEKREITERETREKREGKASVSGESSLSRQLGAGIVQPLGLACVALLVGHGAKSMRANATETQE